MISASLARRAGVAILPMVALAGRSLAQDVTGQFVRVQDDVTLFDIATANPILADVWEFQVTNNSAFPVGTFELGFVGNFLNGFLSESATSQLVEFNGLPVADTFFVGSGLTPPQSLFVVDTGSELSGIIGLGSATVGFDPNIAVGATQAVALFSTVADGPSLGLSNLTTANAVVGGEIVPVSGVGGSPPGPGSGFDATAVGKPSVLDGRVTGEFILVEQDVSLFDPNTGQNVQSDVYEFVVANGFDVGIKVLTEIGFSGPFLNGAFSTLVDSALPGSPDTRVADTFFAGNGIDTPSTGASSVGLIDDGTQLSGDVGVFAGNPWVPGGRKLSVAVFSIPAGLDPLTFSDNFEGGNVIIDGLRVPIVEVPEPGSLVLLTIAGSAALRRRRG
ncbi:MAG: PEP-CTERM sorting domain-containing protein [Planctomycetota bacterium]